MEASVSEGCGDGRIPFQPIAEAELLDHRDGAPVRPEEVVIELLEPHARLDLESGRQAAGQRLALDHGHRMPALSQSKRDGQAERAGAQNCGPATGCRAASSVPDHQGHTGTLSS